MPISGKLSLGLAEKLGEEAASDLINAFNEMDTTHRTEFLAVNEAIIRLENRLVEFSGELKQQIGAVRAEANQNATGLRAEFKEGLSVLRAELKQEIAGLRAEVKQDIAGLRAELKQDVAEARADTIKWSFVFWLGTVGIVMMLLRYFGEGT